ncbi:hypothetical protein SAE02_61440 [Skermanella aerolata]|uniref:Uncharacterized protein n=1 Tax=Skermanella aerolata TaxID=393310 RepID=A0A512DZT8_9PROT|nr:hypothetical protein [Skermanella aerolata]KJB91897.1 hypothetical protein N826_25610 [Skermanella aerolata KACC 11604]GEO41996.1 hypothetical protein SAE02_61440 [Skermanella aerolata]
MRRRGQPEFEVVRVRTRRPILTLQGLSGERAPSSETPDAARGRNQDKPETGAAAPSRTAQGASVQDRGVASPERRSAMDVESGASAKSTLWGSFDLGRLMAEAEEHYATVAPPAPAAPAPRAGYGQAGRSAAPRPVPARIVPDEAITEAAAPAAPEITVPDLSVPDTPVPVLPEPEQPAPGAIGLDESDRARTEAQGMEPVAAETERTDTERSAATPAIDAERPSDAELMEASRRRRAGRGRPSQKSASRPPPTKRAKPASSRRQAQGHSVAKRNAGADTHARDPLTLELPFPAPATPSAQGPSASEAAMRPVSSAAPKNPSTSPEKARSKDITSEQAAEIERLMREIAWAEAEREAAVRLVVEVRKANARMRRGMIFSIVRAAGSLGVPHS